MDFDTQAGLIYSTLSDNEKDMIQYIRNHKADVVDMPINELAKVLLSSKSSVLRLAQKLGYTGYSELKYSLKKDIVKKAVVPTDLVEKFRKEIDKTFEYASQVNFAPLISEIHKARQVILYALFMAGRSNYIVSGETNFEIISHSLTSDDFVIIISLSGNTPGIRTVVNELNMKDIPILSITELGKNFLVENSDYQLYYNTTDFPIEEEHIISMNAVGIVLTILARKYQEFAFFDE